MAEPFTIYKLTILRMLNKVDFPLSNTQIANFFLDRDYTDYFRIQQVINELIDAEMIIAETTHSKTQYRITNAGKETLEFFKDKITDAIEDDLISYFKTNRMQIKKENSILADYYKTSSQNYAARCEIRSENRTMLDLTLFVKTKKQAEAICDNWKKQNEDVYAYLMDTLLK